MFGTDNMHMRNLIPDVMLMQWGEEKCNVISLPRQINSKLGRMVATECKHGFSQVELEYNFQTDRQIAGSSDYLQIETKRYNVHKDSFDNVKF